MDDLSLWEFTAAVEGWAKAQPGAEQKPSSLDEGDHDALMMKHA